MATKRRKNKTAKQTGLHKGGKRKQHSIQGVSVKQHLRDLMRDLSDKQLIAIASQSSDTQMLTLARKLCVEKGLKFTPTPDEQEQKADTALAATKLRKVERKLRKAEVEAAIKKQLQNNPPTSSPFANKPSDFLHPMSEAYGMPEYDLE